MQNPVPLNSLLLKATPVLSAATTAPEFGVPVVNLLSYSVLGPFMHIYWQYEEDVIATEAAFTVAHATEIFTTTTHGFRTGIKVQVSTDGVLPAGLAADTDYYVIKIDANTYRLATSLLNAQVGNYLSVTTNGTGTHTITPQAVAGDAGEGVYLLELPGGYEIDSSFVSVGTDVHANDVGKFSYVAVGGAEYSGNAVAYDATHLAFAANSGGSGELEFVAHDNLGINSADKPVKYSLHAIVPVKGRNYLY